MRVVVHNTDGVNPYAVELVALLNRHDQTSVTLVDAANSEHQPPAGVRWLRLLPGNFSRASPARQALSLVLGLAATVLLAVRGHVVLVAWYRFPVEALAFAALGAFGRPVVYVDHNPLPRVRESRLERSARRALLRRARVVVVHAERLRQLVDPVARDKVVVCPHPPYVQSAPSSITPARFMADGDLRWLAFIGRVRRDKGIHLLPAVLARVPAEQRRSLGLVLCGMGQVPNDIRSDLQDLGLTLHEIVSEEPTPQEVLHSVLAATPLVLAPYVAATQSGSVILALSLGCRVIAFDRGGIPDVVAPEGLVPLDDLDAFAAAISADQGGASLLPRDEWAAGAAAAWSRAVVSAGAPPGEVSTTDV